MKPSIGRIVHYTSYGTPGGEYGRECRAAIITEVNQYSPGAVGDRENEVGLCVMNPTGLFLNQHVPLDDAEPAERKGGTWHWPEMVPRDPGDRPPQH